MKILFVTCSHSTWKLWLVSCRSYVKVKVVCPARIVIPRQDEVTEFLVQESNFCYQELSFMPPSVQNTAAYMECSFTSVTCVLSCTRNGLSLEFSTHTATGPVHMVHLSSLTRNSMNHFQFNKTTSTPTVPWRTQRGQCVAVKQKEVNNSTNWPTKALLPCTKLQIGFSCNPNAQVAALPHYWKQSSFSSHPMTGWILRVWYTMQ